MDTNKTLSLISLIKPMPRKVIFWVLMMFSLAATAQDNSFLSRAIIRLDGQPVQEKVYLHLDRTHYYPGDTVWFKAYTVAGSQHKLSNISGVLYCELIGPSDSVLSRRVLKVAAGITWGEFELPRKYVPGNYLVRAYTNWMRNTGPGSFFEERIKILGPQTANIRLSAPAQQAGSKKADGHPDIQFMPEGGNLVAGLRSRVAVKSVNASGSGQDVSGTIIDNTGAEVASFTTQHLGMGVFALVPESGKTYKARITTGDSVQFTVDLPAVKDKGFTLAVNNSSTDSVYVKVAANEKQFAETPNTMFYLVAQCGGKVYYTAQSKWSASMFTAGMARSRFPSGIVQFTLFSSTGEPLNERIIFNRGNDLLNIRLSSDSASYATRSRVKINLNTRSDTGKKAIGSYSASVINESRIPANENDEVTILNNLLLTSDLKGYIEQPNYYFIDVSDRKRADLDLLMLTQGYRRFEWEKVLSNDNPAIAYKPEADLSLEGVLKTPSGTPIPRGKVTLAATRDNLVTDTTTDMNGKFRFTGLNLSDTAKIVLRARKQHNGSNVNIYVQQPGYPAVTNDVAAGNSQAPLTPEMIKNIADYQAELKQDSLRNGRILGEVKITAKKLPKPDQFNNYGSLPEYDADMKQLSQQQVVTVQALTNVIPGLTYTRQNGFYYDLKPIKNVIIDGIVPDKADAVDFVSVRELESVRVIGISPSTLVITTKRYAGTDTATTKLKEVTIRGFRTPKPDIFNNYGTVPEKQVDMKVLNREYVRVKDGIIILLTGLHYDYDHGRITLRFEHDTTPVRVIIDGFERRQSELDMYSPNEIESIRLIRPTLLDKHPQLIIATKSYAGTDTVASVKLKTVTINAKKGKPKPDLSMSSNLHGGGNADQVIMGDDLGPSPDLPGCLNGHVMGVSFKGDGTPVNNRNHANMSLIVDGVITAGRNINDVNKLDVYSIEVLRTGAARAIYGSSIDGGGALIITTRRGLPRDTTTAPVKLKTVTITARKEKPKPDLSFSSNLNGPGHANQVLMGDDFSHGCINLSDCLNGRLAGVYFSPPMGTEQKRMPYLQRAQGRLSGTPAMSVIIDGMVMDGSHFDDVSPADVYSVEVLRSGSYLAIYGSAAPGGAIVITTRRGQDSKYVTSTAPAGLITYPFQGYHVSRVFYSPKYDRPKIDNDRFDLRNTIYWNPNILTDKDGKVSFEFYNADTRGTYRVVIEGIDDDGKIGRQVLQYKVE